MSPDFEDVRAFHFKFALPTDIGSAPIIAMPHEAFEFRVRFLREEAEEYDQSWLDRNLVKAADSLIDFVYVVYGTALFMQAGQDISPLPHWPSFDRVLASAEQRGYLASRTEKPSLLPPVFQLLVQERLRIETNLFVAAHEAIAVHGLASGIPLAISHLWNAAYAAYLGAAMMSIPWTSCWRHVQAANLAKVRADADGGNSKRRSPWDVVKPAGWQAPDAAIRAELEKAGASL
jgi:predicted HAD superfamily Cof-like phosphohydrolase